MKIYRGYPGGSVVVEKDDDRDGTVTTLDRRLDLRNHSPDGFAWGYGGSGPAQLALAICADALGDDDRAIDIYQEFKFRVISELTTDGPFNMEESFVLDMVKAIENLGVMA